MKLWIDAQLSPALAAWIRSELAIDAVSVRSLGLHNADDKTIFLAAQSASATVLTKDRDFVYLVEQYGIPPHIIWLTCGNTSNTAVKIILQSALPQALSLLSAGEPFVEIRH
jgi:predicted nuclease of predicted toxin-antitoxin system